MIYSDLEESELGAPVAEEVEARHLVAPGLVERRHELPEDRRPKVPHVEGLGDVGRATGTDPGK